MNFVCATIIFNAACIHAMRVDELEDNEIGSESDTTVRAEGVMTKEQQDAYAKWNRRILPRIFDNETSSFLEVSGMPPPSPEDIMFREQYHLAPVWHNLLEEDAKRVGAGAFGTTFLVKSPCANN